MVGVDGVDTQSWGLRSTTVPLLGVAMKGDRNAKTIEDLMRHPLAKLSGISEVELIALRLYTVILRGRGQAGFR